MKIELLGHTNEQHDEYKYLFGTPRLIQMAIQERCFLFGMKWDKDHTLTKGLNTRILRK